MNEPQCYVEDFVALPAARALGITEDMIWNERPITDFCFDWWIDHRKYGLDVECADLSTEIAIRTVALFCYENPEYLEDMVEQTNDALDAWDEWVNEQLAEGRWGRGNPYAYPY